MINPNTEWIGRVEPGADIAEKRDRVARRLAAVLGVPLDEITVEERAEPQGIALTAHWLPA